MGLQNTVATSILGPDLWHERLRTSDEMMLCSTRADTEYNAMAVVPIAATALLKAARRRRSVSPDMLAWRFRIIAWRRLGLH